MFVFIPQPPPLKLIFYLLFYNSPNKKKGPQKRGGSKVFGKSFNADNMMSLIVSAVKRFSEWNSGWSEKKERKKNMGVSEVEYGLKEAYENHCVLYGLANGNIHFYTRPG